MMREKDIDGIFKFIWKHFQVFLQKTILSVNFFLKNELLNHAGAAAFFSFFRLHLYFFCYSYLLTVT